MTWLEKFKKDHPTLADAYIMDEYCPEDGLVSNCPLFDGEVDCKKCWLRPVPEEDGRPMVAPTTDGSPEDIPVAGPIHDPDMEEGPDR